MGNLYAFKDFMDSNAIDLFKNVRYYSSGTLDEKVSQVLTEIIRDLEILPDDSGIEAGGDGLEDHRRQMPQTIKELGAGGEDFGPQRSLLSQSLKPSAV